MKRIGIALVLFLALIIGLGYNVWRANQEPVTAPPSLVEIGRQQLHAQLEQAGRTEAQIEKQDWDSPALLEAVIKAHQQRIDQLKDNSQAGEIVAHDREAIDRLQKRIADLRAQAQAQAATADGTAPDTGSTGQQPAGTTPSVPAAAAPTASQLKQNGPAKSSTASQPNSGTTTHPATRPAPKTSAPNSKASVPTPPRP